MSSQGDVTPWPGASRLRRALVLPEGNGQDQVLSDEEALASVADLVIEDGQPVDSVYVEKQQRLLTEPLYSCWAGPGGGRPFMVWSNVGLFWRQGEPPLVPDVMLSLDVPPNADLSLKPNRSYFAWIIGKVPDLVIEIVSDKLGGEDGHKMVTYARMGVPSYVIFDPEDELGAGVLRAFELHQGTYRAVDASWFRGVKLGLLLWAGVHEGFDRTWLRWCDAAGQVVPTGRERADQEQRDREVAEARAEQERLRAEQERLRAEQERLRAEQEQRDRQAAEARAEQERQRAEALAARLRALGIDPEEA